MSQGLKTSNEIRNSVPRVFVVGAGIRGRKHLTLEALTYLRQASVVLFFPFDSITSEWLEKDLEVAKSESLAPLYQDGSVDVDNYDRISKKILETAQEFGSVAVLIPGHPRVGVSWIQDLEYYDREVKIRLKIIEGISSFDTMLTDLGRDPLEHGAVVIDANRMLLYRLNLDPRMDYYIYHVCSVGTSRTHFSNPALNNRLDLLKNWLLRSFPPNHEVELVQSHTISGKRAIVGTCPLKELEKLTPPITFGTSLFLKGVKPSPESLDKEFLAMVTKG